MAEAEKSNEEPIKEDAEMINEEDLKNKMFSNDAISENFKGRVR